MPSDTMISLPGEIIVYILEDKRLDVSDVVNFSSACKKFYRIVNDSNKLWKTKFFQRWPHSKEIYERNGTVQGQVIYWKEEVKAGFDSRKRLLFHLSLMSSKHYRKQELSKSDFQEFDALFHPGQGVHPMAYCFLVDELINLIKFPAIGSNLTHRYYALKVVRYLKQTYLKSEWEKFISLPLKQQTLERGATIVAQWCQPERHVSYLAISSSLDNIAEQTKEVLREQYPAHSIFSVPTERFIFWKNNILDDNQWSIPETRQATDAVCKVLFEKLGFYGNNEMYYSSEHSFIDRVLERKRGIPITLAIVFESVARRLGIHCEPVIFPSHFLLRWKETYSANSKDAENFYIDVFNGGQFLTKKSCPRIGGIPKCPIETYNIHEAVTAIKVVTKIVNNLEIAARQHNHINGRTTRLLSALELRCMIQPNDAHPILQLGRIYILQHMDLTELIKILENMLENSEFRLRVEAHIISQALDTFRRYQQDVQSEVQEEIEPKKRVPGVKYAVGLIMKNKIEGYLCVITGWDARCKASAEWMDEVNVHQLEEGADQPFYNVFVDDGSCRYTPQENLLMAPNPEWINHQAIGRYFYKFSGTHYIPTEEKTKEYPEDEKARNELLLMYVQNAMACTAN